MKKNFTKILGVFACIFLMTACGESSKKIYEVGKDIEPGEYVLVATGKNELLETTDGHSDAVYGYYAVCTTKDCNIDNGEMGYNNNVTGKAYVIVEDGQYLHTNSMKLYKVNEYDSAIKDSISYDYKLGQSDYYKIGKDLSAGTYTFTGDNFYYAVCSKPSCKISLDNNEVITNENITEENGTSTVTVENGQYLVVSGTKPFTASK